MLIGMYTLTYTFEVSWCVPKSQSVWNLDIEAVDGNVFPMCLGQNSATEF